jgi:hypothetical protein
MAHARHFILVSGDVRARCAAFVGREAPDGWEVMVTPPKMNDGQKARFHAICGDLAASGLPWAGKRRTLAEWKVLLISGHATATNEGAEVVQGLEGELVNVRESTTSMSRSRGASLITYAIAFCDLHDVRLRAPRHADS